MGNKSIYVGSANLTNSGYYAPEGRGNAESMVRVAATNANISAVASFFKPTIELDALIVNQLKVWLTACADKSVPPSMANKDFPLFNLNRSSSLMRPTNLMVSECFYTSADWLKAIVPAVSATLGDDQKHDLSLLGFATEDMPVNDSKSLMELFKRTKIFSWLYGSLADSANNEMYFGELTVNLHSALVDDPRPYRKDVKLMLANLIGWVEALSDCGISVDRPQYSQRVFLAAVDKS